MSSLGDGLYNEGVKDGFPKGFVKGFAIGMRKGSIRIARSLIHTTSMSNQQISDIVSGGVTPEEVEKLRKGEDLS